MYLYFPDTPRVYLCVCMYICMYVCMYVCVCVCVCIYIYTYIHTYIHKYIHIYIHVYRKSVYNTHESICCTLLLVNNNFSPFFASIKRIHDDLTLKPNSLYNCNISSEEQLASMGRAELQTCGIRPVKIVG